MGMTIYESIRELEKARDSIEPYIFIDEVMDQSMKTAIDIMRKYQKIEQIIKDHDADNMPEDYWYIDRIREVVDDGNDDWGMGK